jgi:isocitrate dehydrogenase (NAD+)
MSDSLRRTVTLLPGDGIGPEIVDATLLVLDSLGAPFDWETQLGGMAAIEEYGDPLPEQTLDSIRKNKLALKGPLTTPVGGGFRSVNVRLREHFELFANVRPAKTLLPNGRFQDVDLILIRENLEGLYVGVEHYVPVAGDPKAVAEASGIITRYGCRRVAQFTFEYAIKTGRKKVTVVHKANILKALTGLFLETAMEVGKRYKERIELDECIVDNCAMQLVLDPSQFDVLLTTNMFGDILSDEIAGLVGGLGLAPGANIGHNAAIFEAVHGSAPDIAGKGVANPTALLLASASMLEYVESHEKARCLRDAIQTVIQQNERLTPDMGGSASTEQYARAVAERVKSG